MTKEYRRLLQKQKNYFEQGQTKEVSFRIEQLKKLKECIRRKEKEITEALYQDLHKCEFEAFSCEIMCVIEEINLMIKNIKKWSKPKKVKTSLTFFKAKSTVYREPYGTVLIMTAWNYPFSVALIPLVDALAAGNCAVVKPSELAPATSKLVKEMLEECFPEEYCAVVEGGIEETASLLEERFDFIIFTGSTKVGKIIAEAAAKHLTPTILELGGKSPCIVDEDVDMDVAVRRIAWGKFLNVGQTCVAPDYVLVHKSRKEEFVEKMKKQIREFYGDNPQKSIDYGRIINEKNFDRIAGMLEKEKISFGGRMDRNDCYIEPTLLTEITWDNAIMQDEIFGPVLPIIEYQELDEVIAKLHQFERPLALYIFSKNKKIQESIIKSLSYGGGCINATVQHNGSSYLPFGGVGNSGMGQYHGKTGFFSFTHNKSIMDKSTAIDMKMVYAPFRDKVKMVRKMCK